MYGVRYVSPEEVYSLLKVQNDNYQSSQASDFQGGMERYSGTEECLFACPDSSQVSTSVGIQNRGPSLSVQSHAFRFEHSSQGFHQAILCDYKGTQDNWIIWASSRLQCLQA